MKPKQAITQELFKEWQEHPVTQELASILREEAAVRMRSLTSPAVLDSPSRYAVGAFVEFAQWLAAYIEDGEIVDTTEVTTNVRVDFDEYVKRRLGL